MKKSTSKNKKIVIFLCVILVVCLMAMGYGVYRLIKHEKKQNARIAFLEKKILKLSAEVSSENTEGGEWLEDGYNYLAIGNSITLHPTGSFWWNEV